MNESFDRDNIVRFGGARTGGKTFTCLLARIHVINPHIAKLLTDCLNENLTINEETMSEIPVTTILKNRMNTFQSAILNVAEECYEEMSLKDMPLVEKWADAVANIDGDVWKLLSKVSSLVDREKEVVAKFALAGLWYYYQTPDGVKEEEGKDGQGE